MQASYLWKKLFTKKHLIEHYEEKVKDKPSVGLDKVSPRKFEQNLDENIEIIIRKSMNGSYHFTRYKQLLFTKGPTKPPRAICVPTLRDKLTASAFIYYSKVAWKKGTFVSNTGRKAKNTQDIMIFSKGKARNMRIDTKRTEQTGKLTYMSGCKGMLPTMFDVQPVSKKNRIHQSELPVSLCEQILEFLTYEGEVVLDSFAGSGAVGEAALNLKRNCILIEILKDNIEKIKKRFENNVLMKTAMEW